MLNTELRYYWNDWNYTTLTRLKHVSTEFRCHVLPFTQRAKKQFKVGSKWIIHNNVLFPRVRFYE